MRRSVILVLILLLGVILYTIPISSGPEPAPSGSQLWAALAKANAIPKEATLEARIQLPADPVAHGQVQGELEQLGLKLMAIPVAGDPEEVPGGPLFHTAGSRVMADGKVWGLIRKDPPPGSGATTASVSTYVYRDERIGLDLELSFRSGNPGQPAFLFVKGTLQDPLMLPFLEKHWQEVFNTCGYRPEYATLLTGTLRGIQTYDEGEALMAEIFQSLAVEDPWQVRDDNWVSWGGYSPRLAPSLPDVRGELINVQAALRYHHLEECTYLYLGSPLIYREF